MTLGDTQRIALTGTIFQNLVKINILTIPGAFFGSLELKIKSQISADYKEEIEVYNLDVICEPFSRMLWNIIFSNINGCTIPFGMNVSDL